MVTRVGPSPTGAMHIGGLYAGLISERLAHQSGGVFYLRIEDTDRKREIPGASDLIIEALRHFGIPTDEGPVSAETEEGAYGPYRQSRRNALYASLARDLFLQGDFYPCFCTEDELAKIADRQRAAKDRPGYHGSYALWRDRPLAEVEESLDRGMSFVVRLRARGDGVRRITVADAIRGEIEYPENDMDVVLLKSDGTPTYHLAHVVDDRLMGTTHVVRGDEWMPSLPLHLDLFARFGWFPPTYAHFPPIQKMVGASKRKISKRKDPEASVEFYRRAGYPSHALKEYLLNLANSDYEAWREANPDASLDHFPVRLERVGRSGPMFDAAKLESFGREHIATLGIDGKLAALASWAAEFDAPFADALSADREYSRRVLAIEGDRGRVRKDVAKWSEARGEIGFFFDPLFTVDDDDLRAVSSQVASEDVPAVVQAAVGLLAVGTKDEWLSAVRALCESLGYAGDLRAYREAPDRYKGHIGDVTQFLRVLLAGRMRSPDLFEVMRVLGPERVRSRLGVASAVPGRAPEAGDTL